MPRKIRLDDIPLDEAWRRFAGALARAGCWHPLDGEELPLSEALGRVTAAPVWAAVSSLTYRAGAMDGDAPGSEDLDGDAPESEDTTAVTETDLILPANHLLRPVDLGAIAGGGKATVQVRRRPRVAVIPTGTQLITVEEARLRGLRSGDVIEYTSIVLAAQVEQWGAIATRSGIIDDYPRIRQAVLEAAETHDLVLINAGPSAGSEDFTSSVVEELGTLLVHGVAVRPGHSVVLGMIRTGSGEVPVVGTPDPRSALP